MASEMFETPSLSVSTVPSSASSSDGSVGAAATSTVVVISSDGLPQSMLEDEELLDALNRLVVSKETGEIGFHERDFKWNGKTYVLVKIQVPSPYSVMPKHTEIEVSPYE